MTAVKFSSLNIGDTFHTGKSKGIGANKDIISWLVWKKINNKQATVVEVHGSFYNRWMDVTDNFYHSSEVCKII